MSTEQWAAMMRGDESYAGGESFYRLESAARELTGFRYIIPTQQGRAAERIVFRILCKPGGSFPTPRTSIRPIAEHGPGRIPLVMVAVTNNSGKRPARVDGDIRAIREITDRKGIRFYIGGCRFAENAWFIKQREPGVADRTPAELARRPSRTSADCCAATKTGSRKRRRTS
jgi:tryptophanase